MLMPIAGKKASKEAAVKNSAAKSAQEIGIGDRRSESRGVLKDTRPAVRFAARAQQPTALNHVTEATTSEFDAVDGSSTGT
jgi:hypothetical protein